MHRYVAPLADMNFVLNELIGLERVNILPAFKGVDAGLVESILDEAARFAEEVLAPLNHVGDVGDVGGARFTDGQVVLPDGFAAAYQRFVDQGWGGLALPSAFGGQGCRIWYQPRCRRCGKPPTWLSRFARC